MFEPEANNTNLSATSKLVVCWKDAVPCTVKLPVITSLPVTVNVVPSNVKLPSPLIVPPPVAVNTLLSVLLVIAGNILEAVNAFVAQLAVPLTLPSNEPVKLVADTEVRPVIEEDIVKLSVPSTAKLVPAKSVNKLP